MVFWSVEEHTPELKPPEDPHDDFDDILATRTPTSWDQEEDVFETDVSPDSSVGKAEKIKEDIEMFIQEPKRSATSSDSFFPWPFNIPDDNGESRQVQNTATNSSDRFMSLRETHNTEVADVPFDERIPPSGGSEAPFDECPLTVESAQSTDSSLTDEKVSEAESDGPFTQSIQNESGPLFVSGNNESSESENGENGYPDKENKDRATDVLTQRLQVGLISPTSRDAPSIYDLVYNLEAIARRIDALSNGIEDYRKMDSTSVVMPKSTSVDYSKSLMMGKLSVDRKFKVKVADEVEQCRSEAIQPLGSALSYGGIDECRTMDSTGSQVKRASSVEYTDSLIRKLSTDKGSMDILDDKVDKYDICPKIREGKMFHPPSSTRKKTLITKEIENLEDPLFDKIHQIHSVDTINSILEEVEEPTEVTHKLKTIAIKKPPTQCTILKKGAVALTPSRDALSQPASSKKVSFAQELYETCPSDTSELDFDYMKHAFDENGKNMYDEASVGEDSMEEAFFEESDYTGEEGSPWFSLLLQAN